MKSITVLSSCAVLLFTATVAWGDPMAEVTAAIKKLENQSGYSWTATPKVVGSESRRLGPVEGKANKEGFVYFKSVVNDNDFEVAMKGEKLVVNYTGEWLTPAELGAVEQVDRLRQTLKVPAAEAATLAGKAEGLKQASEGSYVGELDPATAKAMFATLGRRAAAAPEASGSVKFWAKDGQLTKYEHMVRGKIKAGEDKKEVEISRTVTVEIKDAGTTTITLPDTAKKKL